MPDGGLNTTSYEHRDALIPPEWQIGAWFRFTRGVHQHRDGTLRANTRCFVHRIYSGPPDGTRRRPLGRDQVMFDATESHCVTAVCFDAEWTAVQFHPDPHTRPWDQMVWATVRHGEQHGGLNLHTSAFLNWPACLARKCARSR